MSIARHIRHTLEAPAWVVKQYLGDLSDEDLMRRPAPGANHINWQLGHLIYSEHALVNSVCPGSMPPLPEGFAERYALETANSDDPSRFSSKAELMRLMDEQRAGLLAALEKLSDEELERPAPEAVQKFAPTVGVIFSGQATHWMMHAGQWVVVRRQLGRKHII